MPSADLALAPLKSVKFGFTPVEAGWEFSLRSQCCCKAEGAFRPTTRPLIGVGGVVEERRGEAWGKGKAALVFLAFWRKSDGCSNCGHRGRE